ncbi:MAG: CRP/FNR family cyclic AMP-dependent transcriptional regulator [Pseudohongiellaceae bacterium]|jgi:CRP/FNR family cyclic AMP-dependent transcriptional regulator
MAVTPELLSSFPLFKPLPRELLNLLAQQSTVQKFARRAIVLNAGVREEHMCFLFEGRLQGVDFTIDGREVGLYFMEPGDFCGELGLFDEDVQPEYIIALTPVVVVNIPLESLKDIMLNNAGMVTMLGKKLAARVRQMTQQRTLLGLPNVSQRVCCQLWNLVPKDDGRTSKGAVETQNPADADTKATSAINNPPTHQEIAIMLNISRETVTRVFQKLQSQRVVQRDGPRSLLIIDVSTLKKLAEGGQEL